MEPEKTTESYWHISLQRLLVHLTKSVSPSSMPLQGATQHPSSPGIEKEQPGQRERTFQMLLRHFSSWQGPLLIFLRRIYAPYNRHRFVMLIYDRTSHFSKVGVNLEKNRFLLENLCSSHVCIYLSLLFGICSRSMMPESTCSPRKGEGWKDSHPLVTLWTNT